MNCRSHLTSVLTLLLLAAVLFTGCAQIPPAGVSSSAVVSSDGASSDVASSAASDEASSALPSESPLEWPDSPQGLRYDLSSFPVSESNPAYHEVLSLSFPQNDDCYLDLSPDVLMVSHFYTKSHDRYYQEYYCYDTHTGELLGEVTDTDGLQYSLLSCGLVSRVNYADGTASLLNPDFSERFRFVPPEDFCGTLDICMFSPDGAYLLYSYGGEKETTVFPVDGSKAKKFALPGELFYGYGYRGLFYLESNHCCYTLDPVSGEYTTVQSAWLGPNGLTGLKGSNGHYTVTTAKAPDLLAEFSGPADWGVSDYVGGSFLMVDWSEGDSVLTYLDLFSGKKCLLEIGGIPIREAALCDGLLAALCDGRVYFAETNDLKVDSFDVSVTTTPLLLEEIAQLSASMEECHGITFLYGSNGNDFLITDYAACVMTDAAQIRAALLQLQGLLAIYPDGMTRELAEKVGGLSVYLCGKLAPTNGNGISTAVGIAFQENGRRGIALDITALGVADSFAHELMHVTDDLLDEQGHLTGFDYLGGWEALHPSKIHYEYSYHTAGNDKYTVLSGDPWFVDSYAKSFPTEDRARIMEYLIMTYEAKQRGDDSFGTPYFSGTHLGEKAALLCRLLRESFDCLQDAPMLPWEEAVQGTKISAEWLEIFGLE